MTTTQKLPEPKALPPEFTERICNLLLVFIEGLKIQIPEESPVHKKLDTLTQVIKKAISLQKVTDLGKEIQEVFREKNLQGQFTEVERNETKHMVLSMANILKGIVVNVGDFGDCLESCIDEIQATDDLDEILKIKDQILKETQKALTQSQSLKQELEDGHKKTENLKEQLAQNHTRALLDPLTRLLNRSAFNLKLGEVMRGKDQNAERTALVLVDLDHFREFNDQHGPRVGDRVLRAVASTIQEIVSSSDLVFRYGGEEFVVLLYNTSLDHADVLADRIRRQVKKDYLIDKDKKPLKVTISLGITVLQPDDTETTFFERAAQALVSAKEAGRDRAVVLEETVT